MRILSLSITSLVALGLAACVGSSSLQPGSRAQPAVQQPAVQTSVPTTIINAPSVKVRQAIVNRAKSRGTSVASIEPAGIVLERSLTQTPPALEASCGPHRDGRRIRVLLGTLDQGTGTLVSEQRFIVDGANECRIQQTPDVVEDAKRSLNELKTEVETGLAQR